MTFTYHGPVLVENPFPGFYQWKIWAQPSRVGSFNEKHPSLPNDANKILFQRLEFWVPDQNKMFGERRRINLDWSVDVVVVVVVAVLNTKLIVRREMRQWWDGDGWRINCASVLEKQSCRRRCFCGEVLSLRFYSSSLYVPGVRINDEFGATETP